MNLQWADSIQAGGFAAEAALLFVVLRKTRWRTLPVVALLAGYAPFEDVVLLLASRLATKEAYFWAYWVLALGDYGIQLALVAELARSVLKPGYLWVPGARLQFIVSALVGSATMLGVVVCAVQLPLSWLELFYIRASLFTSLLTCVCFLSLTVIANRFRLPRRDHARAIGQGLVIWNVACIVGDTMRSTGVSAPKVAIVDNARMALWALVLCYWAKALWQNELNKPEFPPHLDDLLAELYIGNSPKQHNHGL